MTITPKRGNGSTLTPEIEAEMERLWTKTVVSRADIAERLNERFGTTFRADNIEWHARRRAWSRDLMSKSSTHRSVIEERLFMKSLAREPTFQDNPVKHVKPHTYPAKGYRMGGT